MEKNIHSKDIHTNSFKNLLAVGALSFVLLGNSDNIVAQTQQTKQDLAKNIVKADDEKREKDFIRMFSPVISSIDTITQIPFAVKYKNPEWAKENNFPSYIDINPKMVKKNKYLTHLELILGDKQYNIVPYKAIKIKSMRIIPNTTSLEEPKVILELQLIGFINKTLELTPLEISKYIGKLSLMLVGHKETTWGIHVSVVPAPLKKPVIKNPQNQHLTDSDNISDNPSLAKLNKK